MTTQILHKRRYGIDIYYGVLSYNGKIIAKSPSQISEGGARTWLLNKIKELK